jgi:hypothetical protein
MTITNNIIKKFIQHLVYINKTTNKILFMHKSKKKKDLYLKDSFRSLLRGKLVSLLRLLIYYLIPLDISFDSWMVLEKKKINLLVHLEHKQ